MFNESNKRKVSLRNVFLKYEGFTLVELVVALAILMLLVFAFTPLLLGSIERIYFAGDKSEALYQGQEDIEFRIVEKDTVDEYELAFDFGGTGTTVVTIPGALIEVETVKNDAKSWLSTFMPYVPSIRLSENFPTEGYQDNYPIVVGGYDTKLNESDFVYIYTHKGFESGNPPIHTLSFNMVNYPGGIPDGQQISDAHEEYALFYLPAGLTNAESHYIVEFKWMVDQDIEVKARARMQVKQPTAVAVGESGEIIVSSDANESWYVRNHNVTLNHINDVLYTNFNYYAVSSQGEIITWGIQEEPKIMSIPELNGTSLNSLAFGVDKIIVVGDGGTIAVSSDFGTTWTIPTIDQNIIVNLNAVAWNGSEFVAVGDEGTFIKSTDGITWTDHSPDISSLINLNGISYGNGAWIVVGTERPADPANHKYRIFRISGTDYSFIMKAEGGGNSALHDVYFGTSEDENEATFERFIAVGRDGKILSSNDGISWTESASGTSNTLRSVYYDNIYNKHFIVVGNNGTIITGDIGNWSTQKTVGNNLSGVTIRWEN